MSLYAVTGTFTGVGAGTGYLGSKQGGKFNFSLWGVFDASVSLERSFDAGVTWLNCTRPDLSDNVFVAPVSLVCEEPESTVLYRVVCSAYTSGTVNWRLSL